MVYSTVAPFHVVLVDYQIALESSMLEMAMLVVVQAQKDRVLQDRALVCSQPAVLPFSDLNRESYFISISKKNQIKFLDETFDYFLFQTII